MRNLLYLFVASSFFACTLTGPTGSFGNDDDDGPGNGPTTSSSSGEAGNGSGNHGQGNSGNDGQGNSGNDGQGNSGNDGQGNSGQGGAGNSGNNGQGNNGNAGTGGCGQGGNPNPDCYWEPVCPGEDISDLVSQYGGSNYKDEVIEAMGRRWPAGAYLLEQQKNDPYFAQFSSSSSWPGMVGWLDTLVHEETHLFNAELAYSHNAAHTLYFNQNLTIDLPAEQGFPRSEIYDDLAPALQQSIYNSYLQGWQGDRAFNPLLDEATAYGNEVPGMTLFGEYYNGGVSVRDGSAAFLNFIQVYLRVARTEYPSFYNWAKSQPAYTDAVVTLWLRTHYHYIHADTHPNLGINDGTYRAEAYKQANLDEIEMFTGVKVNDSHCRQN